MDVKENGGLDSKNHYLAPLLLEHPKRFGFHVYRFKSKLTAATHAMHEEGLQMVKNREDQKPLPK